MLKRLSLAFAGLFAFVQIAVAAGTVPGFSLTPQFDQLGHVMPGCKLYVYQAGTVSSPQNPYQDTALTSVAQNPLLCDNSGRLPQWFVADGLIKLRLTDKNGVQVFIQDNLLVVGPSSDGGGGGGGQVDPTTIASTGQIKQQYGTGTLDGWVRLNGRTIGSATSGATERANSDTQGLFEYLWGADANLTVSGGRGVSANADWAANKSITLPDARGRVLASLDTMGNSAAGRLTSTYFGTDASVLGAANGNESVTMALVNLIQHDHTIFLHDPGHKHTYLQNTGPLQGGGGGAGSILNQPSADTSSATTGITLWSDGDNTGNQNKVGATGSATPTPMRTVQPTILVTTYIKL